MKNDENEKRSRSEKFNEQVRRGVLPKTQVMHSEKNRHHKVMYKMIYIERLLYLKELYKLLASCSKDL